MGHMFKRDRQSKTTGFISTSNSACRQTMKAFVMYTWKPVNTTTVGPWNTGRIRTWFSERKTTECFYVCGQIIETLTSRFLGISRKPRTSRIHVTKALPSGLRFEVHVWTAEPRSKDKWFTARFFCILKHKNHTFERKYYFLELFRLLIVELFFIET